MADSSSKTEKPTPKRKREAAKQGQVSRAPDIAAWAGLLALTFFLPGVFVLAAGGLTLMLGSLLWAMADLWPNEPLRLSGATTIWPAVGLMTATPFASLTLAFCTDVVNIVYSACSLVMYGKRSMISASAAAACGPAIDVPEMLW